MKNPEQKFVCIKVLIGGGYNEIAEIPSVDELIRQGWKIISFSVGGATSNSSNLFILLEKN